MWVGREEISVLVAMRERARLGLWEAELEERSGAAAISAEESDARIADLLQGMGVTRS